MRILLSLLCFAGLSLLLACNPAADPDDASPLPLLRSLEDQVGAVRGLAFTPDGEDLVVGAGDFEKSGVASLRIYKVNDGALVRTLEAGLPTGVVFSSDGKIMAVNTNRQLLLWRSSDWTLQNTVSPSIITTRTIPVVGFAFSPDGKSVATRSSTYPIGGQVDLWRVADATHISTALTQVGEGDYLAFTPDGQSIVTTANKQAQIWNVSNGTLVRTLDEATGELGTNLAISPDGRTLATGSTTLWKLADGTRIRDLPVRETVASMAFSPDGQTLATGSWSADDQARLWNVSDGQLLSKVDAGGGTVTVVVFSPDGKLLATGSALGKVSIWQVAR